MLLVASLEQLNNTRRRRSRRPQIHEVMLGLLCWHDA